MLNVAAVALAYVACHDMSDMQHDRARRSLCERLKPYSLPAGHDACQEGDDCDTLWMLTEGMGIPHPQIKNPLLYFMNVAKGVLSLQSFVSCVSCVHAQLLRSRRAARLLSATWSMQVYTPRRLLLCNTVCFHPIYHVHVKKKRDKFTLFSDHIGSLLRRQLGANELAIPVCYHSVHIITLCVPVSDTHCQTVTNQDLQGDSHRQHHDICQPQLRRH